MVNMILKDVAVLSNVDGGPVAVEGGVIERKNGKTLLTFDLADGSVCITIEFPAGLNKDV